MKLQRYLYNILILSTMLVVIGCTSKSDKKNTEDTLNADAITQSLEVTQAVTNNDDSDTEKDSNDGVKAEASELTDEELKQLQEEYKKYAEIYEAEEGVLKGRATVNSSKEGYSGLGYVEGINYDNDGCEFTITVPMDGFYDFNFYSASYDGYKENNVILDNEKIGLAIIENKEFSDSLLTKIYLTKGEHKVSITKHWGWIYLDYLKVTASKETDVSIFQVSKDLINPNADDNTKRLMSFLVDCYGEYVISGQYADNGRYSKEIFAISNASNGNIPAMLGLDLIEYSPSRVENGSSSKAIEYAIEYDSLGGIVTLSWHWNSPSKYLTTKEPWWKGFYKEGTSIDLKKIMNGEDKEGYELLVSDMDTIAIQLKKLEDAGVPILFRPLHEASGGWFWWGASEADAYKELWYLLYDRLTNVHEINNLIWVWNGQHKEWYPGDDYVDIMGEDIYPGERVYTSQVTKFNNALEYTNSKKIIALTENGCLFDPDLAFRDDARWAWFSTWSGEFVINSFGALSEKYTEEDMIKKVYSHEKVLTLNELPDLKKYPIE